MTSERNLIFKQVLQIDEVLVHQVHQCHKVRLCPKYRWCLRCHHIRWLDRIKLRPRCHPTYRCPRNCSHRPWVMTHRCLFWNRKKLSKYQWCRLKSRPWWWADRRWCHHSISRPRRRCWSIEKCRPVRIATFVSAIRRKIKRRVGWRSWCPVTIVDDQVRGEIGNRPEGGTTSRNGGAKRSRQRFTVLYKLVDFGYGTFSTFLCVSIGRTYYCQFFFLRKRPRTKFLPGLKIYCLFFSCCDTAKLISLCCYFCSLFSLHR